MVDRYVYSLIARAVVRGVPRQWVEDVYGFALVPDLVIYLDVDLAHLVPRVVVSRGFDYWESGEDFLSVPSLFDNFVEYQTRVLAELRSLAERHEFSILDANRGIPQIFSDILREVQNSIKSM